MQTLTVLDPNCSR